MSVLHAWMAAAPSPRPPIGWNIGANRLDVDVGYSLSNLARFWFEITPMLVEYLWYALMASSSCWPSSECSYSAFDLNGLAGRPRRR
jgi:hypothetical protein